MKHNEGNQNRKNLIIILVEHSKLYYKVKCKIQIYFENYCLEEIERRIFSVDFWPISCHAGQSDWRRVQYTVEPGHQRIETCLSIIETNEWS